MRAGGDKSAITLSSVSDNYPSKAQLIGDEPEFDRGGNFGRFARTGLMDAYMERLFAQDLSGIPLDAWQRFLRMFSEQATSDIIKRELDRIATTASGRRKAATQAQIDLICERLGEISALLADL